MKRFAWILGIVFVLLFCSALPISTLRRPESMSRERIMR